MKILVVEDDRKVAGFIEQGLKEEGYVVDVAPDGDEATFWRPRDFACVGQGVRRFKGDNLHAGTDRRSLMLRKILERVRIQHADCALDIKLERCA